MQDQRRHAERAMRERAEGQLKGQRQLTVLRERKRFGKKNPVCVYYRLYMNSQRNEADQPIEWSEIESLMMTDLIGTNVIKLPEYVRPLTRQDVAESFLRMYIPEAVLFVLNSKTEPFEWNWTQWQELLTLEVNPYIQHDYYVKSDDEPDVFFLSSTELVHYLRQQLFATGLKVQMYT